MIDVDHGSEFSFRCKHCDLHVASGHNRIVIGDRGPYVEFLPDQIDLESFFVPPQSHIYFTELCSKCEHKIFLYHQQKTVKYADYKIGMFYIGPDLLMTDIGSLWRMEVL